MYTDSTHLYDAIYRAIGKDYAAESSKLHGIIQRRKSSSGDRLLDVACGTARHLVHLQSHYRVEGLDLQPNMIELARERLPNVNFHLGDMTEFDLSSAFDVVVCLFSAIGYVGTEERLRLAVANMARHLAPGGVLVVEPWLDPAVYREGRVSSVCVEEPELKITRMNISRRRGDIAVMDMHYLVGTPERIEHFTELHELALFDREAYTAAFLEAGLAVEYDDDGLMGRGLYIGVERSS